MVTTTKIQKGTRGHESTERVRQDRGEDVDFNAFARRVEKKAYELYTKRGCQDGRAWDDWFEAQRIVEEEMISGR